MVRARGAGGRTLRAGDGAPAGAEAPPGCFLFLFLLRRRRLRLGLGLGLLPLLAPLVLLVIAAPARRLLAALDFAPRRWLLGFHSSPSASSPPAVPVPSTVVPAPAPISAQLSASCGCEPTKCGVPQTLQRLRLRSLRSVHARHAHAPPRGAITRTAAAAGWQPSCRLPHRYRTGTAQARTPLPVLVAILGPGRLVGTSSHLQAEAAA